MTHPAKPPELLIAQKALQAKLPSNMHVGYGYGLDDHMANACWRLYVYTDEKDISAIPKEFAGFPVSHRNIPRAF
jgi:hypothetical protein